MSWTKKMYFLKIEHTNLFSCKAKIKSKHHDEIDFKRVKCKNNDGECFKAVVDPICIFYNVNYNIYIDYSEKDFFLNTMYKIDFFQKICIFI